jgi:hypothetical protein
MAAPSIQIAINDETVRLMWVKDISGSYVSYNLYWSANVGMAGEAAIASNIPNVPDAYYGKDTILYTFKRATFLIADTDEFYVRLKGISPAGAEDVALPGPTRYIPSIYAQREEYHATQIYGYDTAKQIWKKVKVGDDGTLA